MCTKISDVMLPFDDLTLKEFIENKDKYLFQLVCIEELVNKEYIENLKFEGMEEGEITGEDYGEYTTWENIFNTLNYISDRWGTAIRLIYILDLIKLYKTNKLNTIGDHNE